MNRKLNSRQWREFLVEDQAARQHQPPVPAPDGPAGGDGYGEVLAVSAQVCGASSSPGQDIREQIHFSATEHRLIVLAGLLKDEETPARVACGS